MTEKVSQVLSVKSLVIYECSVMITFLQCHQGCVLWWDIFDDVFETFVGHDDIFPQPKLFFHINFCYESRWWLPLSIEQ